jgi:hypothetical protein
MVGWDIRKGGFAEPLAKLVQRSVIATRSVRRKGNWLSICTGWHFAGPDMVVVASPCCYGRKAGE